jgi:hypothetical protein
MRESGVLAYLPANIQPAHIRQVNIQQYHGGAELMNQAQGHFARSGLFYAVAGLGEQTAARVPARLVIIDVQNDGGRHLKRSHQANK